MQLGKNVVLIKALRETTKFLSRRSLEKFPGRGWK